MHEGNGTQACGPETRMSSMQMSLAPAVLDIATNAAGEVRARVGFPGAFAGFQGHFPDHPVLPGVCLVSAAALVWARGRTHRYAVREIRSAKFISAVLPGQEVEVTCRGEPAGGADTRIRANILRTADSSRVAALDLVVTPSPAPGNR
jgi:3-hydroxyacyl-[acyl-carrier-protein] dehydratase